MMENDDVEVVLPALGARCAFAAGDLAVRLAGPPAATHRFRLRPVAAVAAPGVDVEVPAGTPPAAAGAAAAACALCTQLLVLRRAHDALDAPVYPLVLGHRPAVAAVAAVTAVAAAPPPPLPSRCFVPLLGWVLLRAPFAAQSDSAWARGALTVLCVDGTVLELPAADAPAGAEAAVSFPDGRVQQRCARTGWGVGPWGDSAASPTRRGFFPGQPAGPDWAAAGAAAGAARDRGAAAAVLPRGHRHGRGAARLIYF